MISNYELRKGSWVELEDGTRTRVNGYIPGDGNVVFYDVADKPPVTNKNLFPIPLTREVLIKSGFNRQSEGGILINNNNPKIRFENGVIWFGGEQFEVIKSLHALQNFYLASTGSELQIDL